MQPRRLTPAADMAPVLALIRDAFAAMEGRISPPSSAIGLTAADLAKAAGLGELWVLGQPPQACILLQRRPGALHLSKLAVAADARGRGLASALIRLAEARARALILPALDLQCRVELVENHTIYRHLGFVETGRTAHPGFDHPTSVTFRKQL